MLLRVTKSSLKKPSRAVTFTTDYYHYTGSSNIRYSLWYNLGMVGDNEKEEEGVLRRLLEHVFRALFWVFPTKYFTWFFGKNRYIAVEAYVLLVWVPFEIIIFCTFTSSVSASVGWFRIFAAALLSYRLLDIFQSWVSQFIVSKDWQPINPYRSLILVIISFTEIILIYGTLSFIFQRAFSEPFLTISESLYYSVTTATAIGSSWHPISVAGYALFYTQIMFSILFLTFVIQRILKRTPWLY